MNELLEKDDTVFFGVLPPNDEDCIGLRTYQKELVPLVVKSNRYNHLLLLIITALMFNLYHI